ncbi:MAG: TonB family protein [Lentisphaeria bacterium]|nr:TonB family protein [Lentisphaeria bacterium]
MNPGADIVLSYDPGKRPLPYVKGGKLSLIFLGVLLFHGVAVILPFFVMKISDFLNPPLAVEKVSLVESAPNDNEIPTPFPSPKRPVNKGVPPKGEEKVPDFPEFDEIPKIPDPPVPAPVKEEVKKEVREEVRKKEAKKPLEVPPEKVRPVKETKKPEKKKYVDPSEIKVSTTMVKTTKKPPPRTRTSTSPQGKSDAQKRADRIRALLKNYDRDRGKEGISSSASPHGRDGGTGEAGGAGGPKGVTSRELMGYYEQVRVYLMRSWQQPNTALLNNARPEVQVLIQVDSSGRILSARITKRSGNNAMDVSVEDMLNKVKVLPKPPYEMTFTVNVNIE